MSWPGLPTLAPVGASRGGIIEVCSPGQLCREVAAQMALAEARGGSVLWMAVGPQAAGFSSSLLREASNLTLRQRAIETAADSVAALRELLRLVRQQAYTMVVLDGVAGLAPPPTVLPSRGAASPIALPAQSQATAAETAAAAAAVAAATAAVPATAAAPAQNCVGAPGLSGNPQAAWHDSGAPGPINLKFLQNILPLLLEENLAELAASCGPELRTTTLLLNPYTWRERDQIAWGGAGSAAGSVGARSRWARRAILRHASATLHVLPEAAGPAAAAAASAGEHGGPTHCLRAVLSRGGPSGEDGDALRTWSLVTPVRLVSPPWRGL